MYTGYNIIAKQYAVTLGSACACSRAGNMNYRWGWAALEIEKWQGWSDMTLRGGAISY